MLGKEQLDIQTNKVYVSDEGIKSIVMDDPVRDPTYEPSQEDMYQYAETALGMDPVEEAPLLWIACAGLKAPLPEDWRMCQTDSQDFYYFNFRSGESIWQHPLDAKFQQLYEQQSELRRQGKPFKTCMDDEAMAFIHPNKKMGKEKPKKDKKEKKKEKPDLEKDQVGDAGVSTRGKGKFGNLPSSGAGKVKPASLGASPLSADDKPLSAAALGRQALPGIGSLDRKAAPSAASASPGLTSSMSMKTPFGLNNSQSTFNTSCNSDSNPVTAGGGGVSSKLREELEEDLKRTLEQLRQDHTQNAEEDKRQFEQKQKRLRYSHEQETQDMEIAVDKQRNTLRRSNATKQSEWERQLEEQNTSRRFSYERQLNEEFDSWKTLKESTCKAKREHLENSQKEAQADQKKRNGDALRKLERQHEEDGERGSDELRRAAQDVDKQHREAEQRSRDLHDTQEELLNRVSELRHQIQQLDHEKHRLGERQKGIADASQAVKPDELKALHRKEIEALQTSNATGLAEAKSSTADEQQTTAAAQEEELNVLKRREEDAHSQLQTKLAARREAQVHEIADLDDKLTLKRGALEGVRNAAPTNNGGSDEAAATLRAQYKAKHDALQKDLAEEKQRIDSDRPLCDLKASVKEKEEEVRARQNQTPAEDDGSHSAAVAELRLQHDRESERQRSESEVFLRSERERLERETKEKIAALTASHKEQQAAAQATEEASYVAQVNQLKLAGEEQKKSLLQRTGALSVEDAESTREVEEFRAAQKARFEKEVCALRAAKARKEEERQQKILGDMRGRMVAFREQQESELQAALDLHTAQSQTRAGIDEDMRMVREDFSKSLASLTQEYDRLHDEVREQALEQHRVALRELELTQERQLEALHARHRENTRERQLQVARHSGDANVRRSGESEHGRELQELADLHRRQLLDEKHAQEANLEHLQAEQASELAQAKAEAERRQQEMLVATVRRRAAEVSQAAAPDDCSESATRNQCESPEWESVQMAKRHLKSKKTILRKRQDDLEALRGKWEADNARARKHGQSLSSLTRLKQKLDKQAHALSAEANSLAKREYWLQQRLHKIRNHEDDDTPESEHEPEESLAMQNQLFGLLTTLSGRVEDLTNKMHALEANNYKTKLRRSHTKSRDSRSDKHLSRRWEKWLMSQEVRTCW